MTCIVAIKQDNLIILGGDSAASGGNRIVSRKDKKIFKKKNLHFGFSGSFRVGQLIKYQLQITKKPDNTSTTEYIVNFVVSSIIKLLTDNKLVKNNEMDCNLIIVCEDYIFKIDSDFQVEVSEDSYVAIGDGADVALGSLYALAGFDISPLEKARIALEASGKYCTTVSTPYYYKSIDIISK